MQEWTKFGTSIFWAHMIKVGELYKMSSEEDSAQEININIAKRWN